MHIDLLALIGTVGTFGILAIVFAESGLFFGFFLPGDSLLFTAGILASTKVLPFWLLIITLPIAAILGDSVGYWFGRKVGPALFRRPESRLFKPAYAIEAQAFFTIHGKKALVLARFLPLIRTFVPIVAGVGKMSYRDFIFYNIIGGTVWTLSMFLLGYGLGNVIPDPERYLYPIVLLIIFVSFLPVLREYLRSKKTTTQ
jgi:membrane-associated protein